jgi:Domain of unknown function (DUF1906)
MLAHRLPHSGRQVLAILATIGIAAVLAPAGSADASAGRARSHLTAALKRVFYRGYAFEVPRYWPVIWDARHPTTCVRFDLHAVYLGVPGVNQACPSWLVGATEAVLIQPGPPVAARVSIEDPVADSIVAVAPRLTLTATFDTDPTVIYKILASAGLAAPQIVAPNPARLAASQLSAGAAGGAAADPGGTAATGQTGSVTADAVSASEYHAAHGQNFRAAAPVLPSTVANQVGLGFDVCAAPSSGFMRAWMRHSPYRAVGIYIGGANRACDQRNLTPGWVRQQAAAGWRFIPIYAGAQASFGQLSLPSRQGTAAAADAVQEAERLGFGPLTPLYYDMEAYPPRDAGPALRFLSAWTTELHRLGYESGVYSSADSGVVDLARQYRTGRYAMPDVIDDALWNGSESAADTILKPAEWASRRRVHQFSGNVLQTYGGDTMDIDQDFLDLALTAPGGTTQSAPAATDAAGATYLFYEGADRRLWEETRTPAGSWSRRDIGGDLSSAPSVVETGRSDLAVFYRGRSGQLTVMRRIGGRWRLTRELPMMGIIGSPPRAVAQANGVIDVFWSGSGDRHLWHGQYNPGRGWSGPQLLQGSLAGSPYPVETSTGVVEVFWRGTDGRLWRVVRGVGASWTRPQPLGMGPMGGPPHAVALPGGEIDVFWRGSARPHDVWAAVIAGQRVRGQLDLGGQVSGQPWPVFAAGREQVFFRGPGGRLWEVQRAIRGQWDPPLAVASIRHLTSAPFAAAGTGGDPLELFWRGGGDRLWSLRLASAGGRPRLENLGGMVA